MAGANGSAMAIAVSAAGGLGSLPCAMLDAAKRAGKQLIVGFQHRFDAKTKLIRDQIGANSFGKVLYVRAQALRRRGVPNWGVFGRKELQGGGPMIDIGVHILETAHYMIGSPRPVSAPESPSPASEHAAATSPSTRASSTTRYHLASRLLIRPPFTTIHTVCDIARVEANSCSRMR